MYEFLIDQQPIVGTVRDFRPFDFVKVNTQEKEQVWNYMVRTWHYLGYRGMVGPRIKYLVLYQDKLIAAISFNQAALKIGVRDNWIGLSHENILKHGNQKGVFFYIIDKKFQKLISKFPPRQLPVHRPNPKLEHARICNMMLSIPDWSPDLFTEIGVNEQSISGLGLLLDEYMGAFSSCYSHKAQRENGETYIKGLLSDLNRKSIEPIALRYRDEKAVRTLQLHIKDSP